MRLDLVHQAAQNTRRAAHQRSDAGHWITALLHPHITLAKLILVVNAAIPCVEMFRAINSNEGLCTSLRRLALCHQSNRNDGRVQYGHTTALLSLARLSALEVLILRNVDMEDAQLVHMQIDHISTLQELKISWSKTLTGKQAHDMHLRAGS